MKAFQGFRDELPKRFELFTEDAGNLTLAAETGQRFLCVAGEAAQAYRHRRERRSSAASSVRSSRSRCRGRARCSTCRRRTAARVPAGALAPPMTD